MNYPHIEIREGIAYVTGSRVPVESIASVWRTGLSVEEIRENYPTLTLAEVYGAITYYLDHQETIDQNLSDNQAEFDRLRAAAQAADPARYTALRQRMAQARAHQPPTAS